MNSKTFFLMLCLGFLAATPGRAQTFQAQAKPGDKEKELREYQRLAAELEAIIPETTAPKKIEVALDKVLYSQLLRKAGQADWPALRNEMAQTVFTNLALLETGHRRTWRGEFVEVKWPSVNLMHGRSTPPDSISDPKEREIYLAYRSALKASGELSNLRQAIVVKQRYYPSKAIKLVVEAYSRPPAADKELRDLFAAYQAYDFAFEISSRLGKLNIAHPGEFTSHSATPPPPARSHSRNDPPPSPR
ncbi:MAG: hypothetical protein HZA89_12685 [Verrucomicrobia bacterium]|nr:hypothetical protein [Verrucomicrobiota bacterium]